MNENERVELVAFDECVASGRSCEYEPIGPHGKPGCKHCGKEPPPAAGWDNGCDEASVAALRYLADHDRPTGGQQKYNSEHLYQIADELERSIKALRTTPAATKSAAPVAANASAEATYRIGRWLSAALEDPNVCAEMKSDINAWMEAGKPNVQPSGNASAEARLRGVLEKTSRALEEIKAIVWGECPSLLNEDSGGNARLDIDIDDALEAAQKVLSAHPHASDCARDGETTKSEGIGLAQAGTAREAPGSATGCLQRPNTQVDARSSDRTADYDKQDKVCGD